MLTGGDGVKGSPPLTRGALAADEETSTVDRLTPAHAGSTPTRSPAPSPGRAHPRSRGEHRAAPPRRSGARGSPPLTRGARRGREQRHYPRGLTPAHAGSTRPMPATPRPWSAHPRSRGEHDPMSIAASRIAGSPPLTRGAPGPEVRGPAPVGLTPAHAGSTAVSEREHRCPPAHPRSRGEHTDVDQPGPLIRGSPPLTRGARDRLA